MIAFLIGIIIGAAIGSICTALFAANSFEEAMLLKQKGEQQDDI